jgi:4-aminobutyrate aminotransferase
MPIGAAVFDAKYDFGVTGAHSNTYGGNLVACAASLATIDIIKKERLAERAAELGKVASERLNDMKDKYRLVGDVRGLGLMQAVELVKNRKTKSPAKKEVENILELTCKNGLVLLPCGISGFRFIPPLVITEEELNEGFDIFEGALKKVSKK